MIKTNLPVIILKGLVLLPNNDLRLEFDGDVSRNIIDVAEMFHDNKLLVISQIDPLEEEPNLNELPKLGVMARIKHKMELPNGNQRVILTGIARAQVYEFLNLNRPIESLESIVSVLEDEVLQSNEEMAFVRKLYREMEAYIKKIPYVSNSVLSLIVNVSDLSKVTDLIVPHLPIEFIRLQRYLLETSSTIRARMILEDIYHEEELFTIEKELDVKVKQELEGNQREYLLKEKMRMLREELGESSSKEDEVEFLREKIRSFSCPSTIRSRLELELKKYQDLPSMSPEMAVVRNYIDWLLSLPWNLKTVDHEDLKKVREDLDVSHYGLEKVKMRIVEYLAVKKMTNSLKSPILCLLGPPGVGKTSLAFSIAKAMNRNFVKMSVGGVNDEAEIMGHRRTYLGANPGRIIQSMKKAKSMNPVFLIDEIDKMTHDIKGDPASALLEVLDPEQNMYFSDNYIEEDFDLSDVMFIATANYIEDIPEALRDRMEIVRLSGYTEYEKMDIAKKYLFCKLCNEHGIDENSIVFLDETLLFMIRYYTRESGVRELERMMAQVIRKIVTELVLEEKIFEQFVIQVEDLKTYLGKKIYQFNSMNQLYQVGVVNGLAYTSFGGDVLPIEVSFFKGTGILQLTGSLGEVMKESAHIALSYLKSNYKFYHIDYEKLLHSDIHIHVPEGAVPKDGPSAGIALTTALISAFTNRKVDSRVAMTGEITLRGQVLPIGGLKEKSIGAHRNGIQKILIPYDNLRDLDDIPKEITGSIQYIPVRNYKEVAKVLLHM